MKKISIALPLLLSCIIVQTSCKKEPGPGGLATIKGKVYAYDFTTGKNLQSEGYIGDMRVYIAAENDSVAFDDTRTSYDGSFEFPFLRKGHYKVWVFAESDTLYFTHVPGDLQYYLKETDITDKKQEVVLPDFEVNI